MSQNLHIEHPEDTILTGDTSFLQSLKSEINLSTKIDGAPAIVWGTNLPLNCFHFFSLIMTQNLHIEHPEDTILTGDTSFLQSLKSEINLSTKIDGAPAIVWGCLLYTSDAADE